MNGFTNSDEASGPWDHNVLRWTRDPRSALRAWDRAVGEWDRGRIIPRLASPMSSSSLRSVFGATRLRSDCWARVGSAAVHYPACRIAVRRAVCLPPAAVY